MYSAKCLMFVIVKFGLLDDAEKLVKYFAVSYGAVLILDTIGLNVK